MIVSRILNEKTRTHGRRFSFGFFVVIHLIKDVEQSVSTKVMQMQMPAMHEATRTPPPQDMYEQQRTLSLL